MTELAWLLRPRWGAVAAYLVALLLSHLGFVQPMSPAPILWAAGITVATNLLLRPLDDPPNLAGLTVLLLMFDVGLLTWVLYQEGGASNPLSALYLVPIALAAVMLPGRSAYALAAVTIGAFGLLFLAPSLEGGAEMGGHGHGHGGHGGHAQGHGQGGESGMPAAGHAFGEHLRGMWMAYALTAISVAYFVTTVSRSLRRREAQLGRARTRAMRAERVASMAGLAASTAHELGTPLASIKLAASEMQRALQKEPSAELCESLRADAQLVDQEAQRCGDIITAMLVEAGEAVGEQPRPVEAQELLDAALGSVQPDDQPRVEMTVEGEVPPLCLPPRLIAQGLGNLVRNALEASVQGRKPVRVTAQAVGDELHFTVTDRGHGLTKEQLEAAIEPFVTSKPGPGRGIGLFFAQLVAERLGGRLHLESKPGEGTTAHFDVVQDARTLL